jgi:hypothetical protein
MTFYEIFVPQKVIRNLGQLQGPVVQLSLKINSNIHMIGLIYKWLIGVKFS